MEFNRRDLLSKSATAVTGIGLATGFASAAGDTETVTQMLRDKRSEVLPLIRERDPHAAKQLNTVIESLGNRTLSEIDAIHTNTIQRADLPSLDDETAEKLPDNVLEGPGLVVFVRVETGENEVQLVVEPERDRGYGVIRAKSRGESTLLVPESETIASQATTAQVECPTTTTCLSNQDCDVFICGDHTRVHYCTIMGFCVPCSFELIAPCDMVNCNGNACQ